MECSSGQLVQEPNSSEVTWSNFNYWATDSYFDLSYLPIRTTILTGITDMLHVPTTVFKALHFPSFNSALGM